MKRDFIVYNFSSNGILISLPRAFTLMTKQTFKLKNVLLFLAKKLSRYYKFANKI